MERSTKNVIFRFILWSLILLWRCVPNETWYAFRTFSLYKHFHEFVNCYTNIKIQICINSEIKFATLDMFDIILTAVQLLLQQFDCRLCFRKLDDAYFDIIYGYCESSKFQCPKLTVEVHDMEQSAEVNWLNSLNHKVNSQRNLIADFLLFILNCILPHQFSHF